MNKKFKILIQTDDSQQDFLRMLPSEEVAISLNFMKIINTSHWGVIPPYNYEDLFEEMIFFMKSLSEYLSKNTGESFNESIEITERTIWFNLIDEKTIIRCTGNLANPLLKVFITRKSESIVPYQNKIYSIRKGSIEWIDLLKNISNLIIDFHKKELVVFNEYNGYEQLYKTLSLRGFLINEVSAKLKNV
jgi:hypothetical protein